jgi:hypothetical protein
MTQGRQPENTDSDESNAFRLRVVPWWTDDCSTFLNNVFKWLPRPSNRQFTVLEFGGGNSTFYLLSKKCKVVTVESDDGYIELLLNMARQMSFAACTVSAASLNGDIISENDLIILKATSFSESGSVIDDYAWDFIVNDGVSRREILKHIQHNAINSIIILDNAEYCANWGRLDRSSAKPDLIKVYRSILRDANWRHYVFEQAEGREGRGSADKTGWEAPHRWASAVLWPQTHLLSRCVVSNIGLPLVNELGADDSDIETLSTRCPFDWETMQWAKAPFPDDLDLKLPRRFD